ncbi:hypothetical protein [Rhodoferax sp. GW822-FHT02A01]|uniref:hypothetical protein n=1 Tax=Rhodoferax sp. GW822-FHT02A01 TaxID=3141537 RepID=UPI00315D1689
MLELLFLFLFVVGVAALLTKKGFGVAPHNRVLLADFAVSVCLAFAVLGVLVYSTYVWGPVRMLKGTWMPGIVGLSVFSIGFSLMLLRRRTKVFVAVVSMCIALPIVSIFGLVLWLFVACANGDCI